MQSYMYISVGFFLSMVMFSWWKKKGVDALMECWRVRRVAVSSINLLTLLLLLLFLSFAESDISSVARRNLVLVSKVLQNLSNNVLFGNKEQFLSPLNAFLEGNKNVMNEYLLSLKVSHYIFRGRSVSIRGMWDQQEHGLSLRYW